MTKSPIQSSPDADEDSADNGTKPYDTAVRRALIEARQEMLSFLQQRLRNRSEAEEVLQRFSLRALERIDQLRDVQTVRGWLGRILAVRHQRL